MRVKLLILLLLILPIRLCLAGESLTESFYRKTYESLAGKSCDQSVNGIPCKVEPTHSDNKANIQDLSENLFFNRLAGFEKQRLMCGERYWQSLTSGETQTAMIKSMEEVFPQLNSLKSKINKLTTQNTALFGQMPHATNPKELEVLPRYVAQKKEYDDRAIQIEELNKLYEAAISQIPHSDIPDVREFIESHAGPRFFTKNILPITSVEFNKLSQKVVEGIQKSIKNIGEEISAGQLSDSHRESFATDGFLIGQLAKESPNLSGPIAKYQCLAENRKKGKEVVQNTVNVVSFILPLGAGALAKLGRIAFIANVPRVTSATVGISRVMGMGAMLLNTKMAIETFTNQCIPDKTSSLEGSCEQTPKTIMQQSQIGSCIFNASIKIGLTGVGFIAKRMADRNSELAKFVEEMKGRRNLRNQNLPLAGSLTDAERVATSEMILESGRFTAEKKDALLRAHRVGNGFGTYTEKEIEDKRRILEAGGFSLKERETLLWKGLAGENPQRFQMIGLAKPYASTKFGRQISDAQATAIVDYRFAMVGGDEKTAVAALKSSGLSDSEIAFVKSTSGGLNGTYIDPIKLAAEKAAAETAARAARPPPPPPPPPPNAPSVSIANNPYAANPKFNAVEPDDLIYRFGSGHSKSDRSGAPASYLSAYSKEKKVPGATVREQNFNAMNRIIDETVKNMKLAKIAAESKQLNDTNKETIKKNLALLRIKCKGLSDFAIAAGYNGNSFQESLIERVREACWD